MIDWNDLPPDQQRQELAEQMRISRDLDWVVRSHSVEALARSRELLAVPVYRWQDLQAAAVREDADQASAPDDQASETSAPASDKAAGMESIRFALRFD